MYSYGSPHMAPQKQDDQLERTFSSYVRIQDVVPKTYLGRWTIGRSGERGSGISVLPARYDDDDIYIYIYIYTWNISIYYISNLSFKSSVLLLMDHTLYIYIYIYIYIWKHLWSNGYRCRKCKLQLKCKILDGAVCIFYNANTLERAIHSAILPPTMIKQLGRQGSLTLVW